jgi:hypothetical protein
MRGIYLTDVFNALAIYALVIALFTFFTLWLGKQEDDR